MPVRPMDLNTKFLMIFVTVCSMTLLQPLLTQAKATVTNEPTESYEDTTDTIENLNATTARVLAILKRDTSLTCRRVPRIVNFHDNLDYSFVSAPVSFDMGDCVGDCPVLSGVSTTYSEFKRRLDGEYLPCCAPTEFQPLHVIVQVYNPIEQRTESRVDILEDASVKSCGCH